MAQEGTTATRDPNRMHRVTRNYLPLENTEIQLSELLKEALWHHGHAMYVTISFGYYWNPRARGFRHRVPRYLLPTRIAPWAAGLPGQETRTRLSLIGRALSVGRVP